MAGLRKLITVLVLLQGALLFGCNRNGAPAASTAEGKGHTLTAEKSASEPPSDFSVTLLPAEPTATQTLVAMARGCNGGVVFHWEKNGEPILGRAGDRLPAGNFSCGDRITVTLTSGGRETRASVTIGDSPPRILSAAFENSHFHRGMDIVVVPKASDPDGDPVTFRYRWLINGEEAFSDTNRLPGDSFHRGDRIQLEITPSDGQTLGPVFRSKTFVVPDAPPDFLSQPPKKFKAKVYLYSPEVKDPDGDTLSYSLQAAPAGMAIDSATGRIRWPLEGENSGEYDFKIVAQDGLGGKAVQEIKLRIAVPE